MCVLLHYGFPLDFDRSCLLLSSEDNHSSAITYSGSVTKYLLTTYKKSYNSKQS